MGDQKPSQSKVWDRQLRSTIFKKPRTPRGETELNRVRRKVDEVCNKRFALKKAEKANAKKRGKKKMSIKDHVKFAEKLQKVEAEMHALRKEEARLKIEKASKIIDHEDTTQDERFLEQKYLKIQIVFLEREVSSYTKDVNYGEGYSGRTETSLQIQLAGYKKRLEMVNAAIDKFDGTDIDN